MSSETLCEYIEFLQVNSAYSSIRRRILSLRRLNKLLGFEDHTRTEEVYLAIRRLKRAKCLKQKQAVGINHRILVKMIAAQPDTLAVARNRAFPSLGYVFLARRSELAAIRSDDLSFTPDGALTGMISKSKTDRYGKDRPVFGSERNANLVKKWLRLKPQEIQPVFCAIKHVRCEDHAICDRYVNDISKRSVVKVKRCERPPNDLEVSGHLLRVGAAQDLLL